MHTWTFSLICFTLLFLVKQGFAYFDTLNIVNEIPVIDEKTILPINSDPISLNINNTSKETVNSWFSQLTKNLKYYPSFINKSTGCTLSAYLTPCSHEFVANMTPTSQTIIEVLRLHNVHLSDFNEILLIDLENITKALDIKTLKNNSAKELTDYIVNNNPLNDPTFFENSNGDLGENFRPGRYTNQPYTPKLTEQQFDNEKQFSLSDNFKLKVRNFLIK